MYYLQVLVLYDFHWSAFAYAAAKENLRARTILHFRKCTRLFNLCIGSVKKTAHYVNKCTNAIHNYMAVEYAPDQQAWDGWCRWCHTAWCRRAASYWSTGSDHPLTPGCRSPDLHTQYTQRIAPSTCTRFTASIHTSPPQSTCLWHNLAKTQ